jgi:hypothetical protein
VTVADLCCAYAIAGITINNPAAGADRLLTSFENGHILGLDGAPIRSQVDPKGATDGGIVHTKYFGARVITFQGEVQIQSVLWTASSTAYLTAMNTLEASVVSALEGIRNSASTLSWTPTGLSARSISVTYGVPGQEIQFDGAMVPGERTFSFSLIAASPTIA